MYTLPKLPPPIAHQCTVSGHFKLGVHTDAILLGVQFLGVYHATHHIARHAANGFEDAPLPCCALESTVAEEVPMFPVRKMNEGGAMQSRTILGRSSAMHAKCLI